MGNALEDAQKRICDKYGVSYCPSPPHQKLGIALNVRAGIVPLQGLRHPTDGDTSAWYVWAGEELSTDPDFFKPLHLEHLPEWCPIVERYLGLPPGWRFLIAGDYEDVWYDASLLTP